MEVTGVFTPDTQSLAPRSTGGRGVFSLIRSSRNLHTWGNVFNCKSCRPRSTRGRGIRMASCSAFELRDLRQAGLLAAPTGLEPVTRSLFEGTETFTPRTIQLSKFVIPDPERPWCILALYQLSYSGDLSPPAGLEPATSPLTVEVTKVFTPGIFSCQVVPDPALNAVLSSRRSIR